MPFKFGAFWMVYNLLDDLKSNSNEVHKIVSDNTRDVTRMWKFNDDEIWSLFLQ